MSYSTLEGQYKDEDAKRLVELASKCLQYEARDRPDIKYLLTSFAPFQKQKEVTSLVLMGLTKAPAVLPTLLSPLGKACTKMDLATVHVNLLKTGYKDEEGVENEAFCDLEPIYTYEGTYDINTAVTAREITGLASFKVVVSTKRSRL